MPSKWSNVWQNGKSGCLSTWEGLRLTDPASATPSLPAPASISLISSIFAAAQFLRHLALYILSCGQLEGRRRGGGTGNAGIFPSFTRHRHLPINFLYDASSDLPTSAVNPCDLDFKALVFHSHCSLGSTPSQSIWQVARSLWGRREHQT